MQGWLASRRLRLVWTALVHIAADAEPVSGKVLSERLNCSRRYLEADLQSLAQCGLLDSRRGAKGGYLLSRSPQRLSLLDVLQCLGSEKGESEAPGCPVQQQVVMVQLEEVQAAMGELLTGITLADAVAKAEAAGLLRAPKSSPDFCI
ncbi:MAG TPA: Rrf2 family transcriptional regulator [Mariprofundaceae bacterium]|nr:Rrf2 family transcriptional regulator [Mariprofundaceae bacterium]